MASSALKKKAAQKATNSLGSGTTGIHSPSFGLGGGAASPNPPGFAVTAPPAAGASAAPTPVPVPGDTNGDGRIDPFFRPDDLASMANFWSQWNTTFAQLDSQLADLRTQTTYDRTQLGQQHTQNTSDIQDNAAARGISQSSIKDGNTAQEQTNYTRSDQLLQDKLANQEKYTGQVKNDFQTQTLPQMLAAWAGQKAANASDAQGAYDAAHPPPPPGGAVAAGKPEPKVNGYSGVAGTWDPRGFWVMPGPNGAKIHQYPDGHRQTVR